MKMIDRNENRALVERVSTGCGGLDEILCGGLPAGRTHLLVGSAGTGKTILSLQFLRAGLEAGERAMYVTLMESAGQIARDIGQLGWNMDGISMVDLSPQAAADGQAGEEYRMFAPAEVERVAAWQAIYEAVERERPARLIIDSVTQLRYLSTDDYQFRKHILQLVAYLNSRQCTTLLPFEPEAFRDERSVELAVDGVMHLSFQISTGLSIGIRTVEISKLRSSDFITGRHAFRIAPQGLQVFPHRIERTSDGGGNHAQIGTGIAELDELLGGGLEAGTTTLLSGPTGVGKTTLGLQILSQLPAGTRAALLTFEEARDTVLARARGVGLSVDLAIAAGSLRVQRINPLELYPDELLEIVRNLVENEGVRYFMLDSLRGYELAMEEFGKPEMHIHNLLAYLGRMGVTTFVIAETDAITGAELTATEIGVSHLADNIILMRYAEFKARLIKVVGCLKKRLGGFQPELRELRVTAQGIALSGKLDQLHGILTGTPVLTERTST
jgi:circadian clock protein KaiC